MDEPGDETATPSKGHSVDFGGEDRDDRSLGKASERTGESGQARASKKEEEEDLPNVIIF